jgi:hypothetical protein
MIARRARGQHTAPNSPYEAVLCEAVDAIAAVLKADPAIAHYLWTLLRMDGQQIASAAAMERAAHSSIQRFIRFLIEFGLLQSALVASTRADDELRLANIRSFFLNPQTTYKMGELAALWRVTLDDVLDIFDAESSLWAVHHGDVSPAAMSVHWQDAAQAMLLFNIVSAHEVERALGDEFVHVRPEEWHTEPVPLRLPRWLIQRINGQVALPSTANLPQRIENILLLHMDACGHIDVRHRP